MTRVKLRTGRAGPNFTQFPGDVVEMSPAEAQRHVDRGYAEWVDGPPAAQSVADDAGAGSDDTATGKKPASSAKSTRSRTAKKT